MGIHFIGACRLCGKAFEAPTPEKVKAKAMKHMRQEHWKEVGFKRKPRD